METKMADVESAPTGNNMIYETVGAESISVLEPKIQYKHNRRSLRLKHYDYGKAGYYFITICTQDKVHLFGEIVDGEMVLNDAGLMVDTLWHEIMDDFPNTGLHEFVIMPNHIHGIIEITHQTKIDIPKIIQSFKRHTTLQYIKMVKNGTLPPFNKRIWQRNYYEHIMRDDVDYERIAVYIVNNPVTWENDTLNT